MDYRQIFGLVASAGLIVAGLILRFSKQDDQKFGNYQKRWYVLVVIGTLLLLLKLYNIYK
jgi:hypothetical protein